VFPQTKLLYVLSPCKLTKNLVRLFDLEKSDLAELKQKYDELSTIHKQCVAYFELNMSLQVMQTLNFTQVFQIMQLMSILCLSTTSILIFSCTLAQIALNMH
jgi:hypothetical protein